MIIRRRPRKKQRTANRVLIVLGVFLLAFVAAMIVTYWVKGGVPDTLIQYTLGPEGWRYWCWRGSKFLR